MKEPDTLKKKKGAGKAHGAGPPYIAFSLFQSCRKGCLGHPLRLPEFKGHERSGVH